MKTTMTHDVGKVAPGTKTWIDRTFTDAQGRSFVVRIGVIQGAKPGRTFANIAGQHGMEHMGPFVLRNLFDELDPQKLSGTLLLCPSANPLALMLDSEFHPEHARTLGEPDSGGISYKVAGAASRNAVNPYNMNRLWPDDIGRGVADDQGVARQITEWLWGTMIESADVVLDHHAVKSTRKPYLFADGPIEAWTPLLGTEGVWSLGDLPPNPTPYAFRRLTCQSIKHGKVGICIEYSVQHVIKHDELAIGRFAVLNMCKALGMLPGQPVIRKPVWLIKGPYWEHMDELRSDHVGHAHILVDEYEPFNKGQTLAQVRDIQTHDVLDQIIAPYDGLMLHGTPRAVHRPDRFLCRITRHARLIAQPGKPYPLPPLLD